MRSSIKQSHLLQLTSLTPLSPRLRNIKLFLVNTSTGNTIIKFSPQGCSKTDNCTFIHDERFRGVPVVNPQQNPPPNTMPNNQRMHLYPPNPQYGGYMPTPMPMVPPNIPVNPSNIILIKIIMGKQAAATKECQDRDKANIMESIWVKGHIILNTIK